MEPKSIALQGLQVEQVLQACLQAQRALVQLAVSQHQLLPQAASNSRKGSCGLCLQVEQLRQARLEAQSAREQLAESQRQAALRAAADERLQNENARLLARLQEQGQMELERAGSSDAAMPSSDAAVLAQVMADLALSAGWAVQGQGTSCRPKTDNAQGPKLADHIPLVHAS